MSTVIVPLDRSDLGRRALRVASLVARNTDRDVALMAVTTSSSAEADDRRLQEAAAELDVATSTVLVARNDVGSVADGIVRAVADAGPDPLVCIASHGRGGLGAGLLGSTTEDLLAGHDGPVLVVGPHCSADWPARRRMVVPLDGSERVEQILPQAAGLASDWGLETWLLQVVHPLDTETLAHVDEGLTRARERMVDLGVDAKVETRFSSDVSREICQQAEGVGASVIVMSTFQHPGVNRMVLGSVTMDVVHDVPCPVLVMPAAPAA